MTPKSGECVAAGGVPMVLAGRVRVSIRGVLLEVPEASMSAAAAMRLTQLHGETKSTRAVDNRHVLDGAYARQAPGQTGHDLDAHFHADRAC